MKELFEYIRFNKLTKSRIASEIRDERNRKLPLRNYYSLLRKYSKGFFEDGSQPRMIALSGLRGVGKTTLMWQTANYVFDNFTKEIFFVSADDLNRLNATLYDFINTLEKEIFKRPLNELRNRIMILIDEVHESENWQKDLKILYEKGKKIFVLVSGSSALMLHSSSDIASRWTLLKIYPFTFPEFILAKSWFLNPEKQIRVNKKLSEELQKAIFFSSDFTNVKRSLLRLEKPIIEYLNSVQKIIGLKIKSLIDEYIGFYNIARFLPIQNKTVIIERIIALFERIIIKDIPDLNLDIVDVYNRLLFRLSLSDEVNYQTLSNEFGVKQSQIEHLITSLNNAEILNVFLPHGGIRSRTGKNLKPFFMSPSLRRALITKIYGEKNLRTFEAKFYEDILALYLKSRLPNGIATFGFGKEKNPDFIIETNAKPVLMEIGKSKKTAVQITGFQNYRYGLVVSLKTDKLYFNDNDKIIFIPLPYVLLM